MREGLEGRAAQQACFVHLKPPAGPDVHRTLQTASVDVAIGRIAGVQESLRKGRNPPGVRIRRSASRPSNATKPARTSRCTCKAEAPRQFFRGDDAYARFPSAPLASG